MTHLFGTLVHIHTLPPYCYEYLYSHVFTDNTQITPLNRLILLSALLLTNHQGMDFKYWCNFFCAGKFFWHRCHSSIYTL
jgi:hypothetical protein